LENGFRGVRSSRLAKYPTIWVTTPDPPGRCFVLIDFFACLQVDWPSYNGPSSASALRLDYRHYETDCEAITIELIGAGLPRTGTLTQKMAFEELGLAPCYHWVNVIADLDQVELWMRAMDGGDPWEEVFAGQRSSTDWPGGYFYRQLMDHYPDAKVLLSVRDGESWERSFRQTIVEMCHGESLMPKISKARATVDGRWERYLELVDRMFWGPQGTFADGWAEPAQLIEQMHAHNERVKQVVPAERLLVWDVREGWEPLCEFLERDVPATPLPHANERDTFVERVVNGALDWLQGWREQSAAPAAG
jgi:hypothetical protein